MVKQVHEVFEEFDKAKTVAERVKILQMNETWALKDIIKGSMHPKIEWLVPTGEVPYTKCNDWDHPTTLLKKHLDFKYVAKGSVGDSLPSHKREMIFLGIVESIHPADAELVCKMINKKPPTKRLTVKIVKEAFPGLL